jgi:hypothetical protein
MLVINKTRMKPGNPRLDCLVEEARREMESFLVYNPSRRKAAFIEVTHAGGRMYRARGCYASDQGRSTPVCVYGRPPEA